MKKLMVLAAMLAMMMVAAAPALADHQVSGNASAGGATLTAGDLANQAVQVANNVNTGNVDQDATINNTQVNIGQLAVLEQTATVTAEDVRGRGIDIDQEGDIDQDDVNQTVEQNATNVIAQDGIDQTNNAQLSVAQAIAQVK